LHSKCKQVLGQGRLLWQVDLDGRNDATDPLRIPEGTRHSGASLDSTDRVLKCASFHLMRLSRLHFQEVEPQPVRNIGLNYHLACGKTLI
jgi:hypothetical protein